MQQPRSVAFFQSEDPLEGGQHAIGNDCCVAAFGNLQRIESDRIVCVRRVEQDDVVRPMLWNQIQGVGRKIAVWFDNGYAATRGDVFCEDVLQQRGFAHACLPDCQQMPTASVEIHGEPVLFVSKRHASECD